VWAPQCTGNCNIRAHEGADIILIAAHGGTQMGKTGVSWVPAYSNHICACMHVCVLHSSACVCNCIVDKRVCVCDRGACVHPYIIDSHTCVRDCGMNRRAYVCTYGEKQPRL